MKDKDTKDKQNLKTKRVKSYFIQAAKSIIITDGIENVSVRKVADLAGYTFTTIYNYFTDLNELLQDVKGEMIQDLMIHMQGTFPDKLYDLTDVKELNHLYMKYFIDRPNVFSFFYSYRMHPIKERPIDLPDFNTLYMDTYKGFVISGTIKESDIPIIAKTIIYTIHGLLALYYSDNGMTTKILYEELDKIIDYLLGGN